MPTRSGKTFSPTPPVAQTKAPNRRGTTSQNRRVTRASTKRTRAASDASLIEVGPEQKSVEARPISRSRKRIARKSKRTDVEPPQTIDLTRDEDEDETPADQQTSQHLTTEVLQNQHDADREGKAKSNRREVRKGARQAMPAAMPYESKVPSLWQIDLAGASPPPSALAPSMMPEDIDRKPLWQIDLAGTRPHHATITPLIVFDESTLLGLEHNTPPAHVVRAERPSNQRQEAGPPPPARVMFTYFEARNLMYDGGRTATSQTVPPYTLSTGERVPFPVTKSYHLGAMGRYTKTPSYNASSRSIVDSSAYVFDWGVHCGSRIQDVPRIYIASLLSSPNLNKLLDQRQGLFEALKTRAPNDPRLANSRASQQARTLPIRALSQTPIQAPDRPAQVAPSRHRYQPLDIKTHQRSAVPVWDDGRSNSGGQAHAAGQGPYTFTFGQFRGKAITEAPVAYLRSLENNSQLRNADPALRLAFDRHFPHGVFRYEVDNYRIDDGPYRNRRLSEVPNSYIYSLQRDSKRV